MRVGDFMSRGVFTVTPDTTILAAAKLMLEHKISGLPVVDAAGHIVGIVSEHDLLRLPENGEGAKRPHWLRLMIERVGLADASARFQERKVSEVMTPNPVTVTADAPLEEACRLIADRGIKRLPVVKNSALVGIIARADLVRALARSIERSTATSDASVAARRLELERQIWRDRSRLLPF